MRQHEFWRLINSARKGRRRCVDERRYRNVATVSALRTSLGDRSLPEVIGFHRQLGEICTRAHRWDLWTAFDIVLGTLSGPRLHSGVPWLVLQGKRTYRRVLADPDTLAEHDITGVDLFAGSSLMSVAREVLNPDEDEDLDWALDACLGETDYDEPPPGEPPDLDDAALRRRYPRLTERYLPRETAAPERAATGPGGAPR